MNFTWQSAACFSASEFWSIHLKVEKKCKSFYFIKKSFLLWASTRKVPGARQLNKTKKGFNEKKLLEKVKKFQKYRSMGVFGYGKNFTYSGRRLYQYNENDFLFKI